LEELSFLGTDGQAYTLTDSYGSAQTAYNDHYGGYRAFENSPNSQLFYCKKPEAAGSGGWLQYDFQTPTTVAEYKIEALNGHGKGHNIKSWQFEGSDDGQTWEVLDERTDQAQWANAEVRTFPVQSTAGGSGKAGGDPHVQNVKGERFNIVRKGNAPLVSIASAGAAHLEVTALIEGVKKCEKKMFITQINASGSWLEQNIAVYVGGNADQKAFSVTVDGQEVWSPVVNNYKPPTDEKIIFNRADKFSIQEITAKAAGQPGVELHTAHDIKMKIVRPLLRPTAPPHLNFDIQGLNTLPFSFKLSGLLSQEAHSYWSTREETCGTNFAHIMTEGSIAVAQ